MRVYPTNTFAISTGSTIGFLMMDKFALSVTVGKLSTLLKKRHRPRDFVHVSFCLTTLNIMASSMRLTPSLVRPLGLARPLQQQPFLAPKLVFSQLPKATVLGIRSYASNQQQGKQILLRDHGVFGKLIRVELQHKTMQTNIYKKKS